MKRPGFCTAFGPLLVLPVLLSSTAWADEFAVVPAGDAVYSNLSAVARFAPGGRSTSAASSGLTRYEAALQTARIIVSLTEQERGKRLSSLTKDGSRALRDLITTLRPELRQLEVDPDAALALVERASKPATANRAASNADDFSPRNSWRPNNDSPLRSSLASRVERPLMGSASAFDNRLNSRPTSLNIELSPRLRAGAALLAMQRETADPFGDSARAAGFARSSVLPAHTGSASGSVSYGFNSWLSLRAGGEYRNFSGQPRLGGSLLNAPLFAGAGEATATGGGVDVNVGPLRLSTDVANVATNTGTRGTQLGGGVGLSAWQNRLSLSAHLSTLKPRDSAALDAVATELNVGLDVSHRLSLGMQYQGLFTDQTNANSSRVAGGLTLNF